MLKASRGTSSWAKSCTFIDGETEAWRRAGSDMKNLPTQSPPDTHSTQDRTRTGRRGWHGDTQEERLGHVATSALLTETPQ